MYSFFIKEINKKIIEQITTIRSGRKGPVIKAKGISNIRKKRARGEPMRKKGEKGAPTADDIKRSQ